MVNSLSTSPVVRLASKPLVFRSCNDLILQSLAEVAEVVAVAGDAHDEIAVLLRMSLCFAERCGVHHVELNMMAPQLKIRSDEV